MIDKYCIVANRMSPTPPGAYTQDTVDTDASDDMDDTSTLEDCTRFGESDPSTISFTADVHVNGIYDIPADTRSVTFKGVLAKYRWQFEVFALNGATDLDVDDIDGADATVAGDADSDPGLARESDKALATTKAAMKAMAPPNLTAELARDTNVSGIGSRGVLVLWNAPADPAGAPVLSYRIDRKIMGKDDDFVTRHDNLDADVTHWVDSSEPLAGEIRYYRVTSINSVGVGTEMATIIIPLAEHTTHPPGTVGDASGLTTAPGPAAGTAVLTWTEGDDANINWVFGYCRERVMAVSTTGSGCEPAPGAPTQSLD